MVNTKKIFCHKYVAGNTPDIVQKDNDKNKIS